MSNSSRWFQFDAPRATLSIANRTFQLPKGRLPRLILGGLFILGGCLWFLPVLGAWMLPIGLLILSLEFAFIRRLRRRFVVWRGRRQGA